jgi:NitT/TauT family transport system substrate-binding protein
VKTIRTRLASTFCLSALLMTGCASQADVGDERGGETVVVSEVIRSVFYAPLYVADGAGIFEEHGLDVQIETANGSDKVTAALLGSHADIGLLGPESAVFLQNQDSSQKVMVFHQLTQRDGSFLLGRDEVPDFSVDDLAGQTVLGWRPGSMPQLVMQDLLDRSGVTPQEYVTNIQAPAMPGAFSAGQGDVIQVFEPVATSLIEGSGAHLLASVGQLADPFPYTTFAALDGLGADEGERLAKFSAAMSEATDFVLDEPSEEVAAALASYFPDSSPELLAASIERYREAEVWAEEAAVDEAQFDHLLDIMVAGGVLEEDQRVAYGDVVTTEVAEAAQEARDADE